MNGRGEGLRFGRGRKAIPVGSGLDGLEQWCPCGKWLRWFTAMVSRLPHGSLLGGDATGREGTGRTAWPLPEDGGGHPHRCRHRPKKGSWEGRGAYSVPVEKTAVLILFGPLLT